MKYAVEQSSVWGSNISYFDTLEEALDCIKNIPAEDWVVNCFLAKSKEYPGGIYYEPCDRLFSVENGEIVDVAEGFAFPEPPKNTQEAQKMTVIERVRKAIDKLNCEEDNLDKLIALAYYIGREEATREVSDKYNAVLAEQRERADNCRYHKLAHQIIGSVRYIHTGDYSQDMKNMFGSDETEL